MQQGKLSHNATMTKLVKSFERKSNYLINLTMLVHSTHQFLEVGISIYVPKRQYCVCTQEICTGIFRAQCLKQKTLR